MPTFVILTQQYKFKEVKLMRLDKLLKPTSVMRSEMLLIYNKYSGQLKSKIIRFFKFAIPINPISPTITFNSLRIP